MKEMAKSMNSQSDDKQDDTDAEACSSSNYESELEESDSDNDEKSVAFDKFDSSDEEDLRNTIGNIPVSWYDSYDHIGYNWDGRKFGKGASKTEIEDFLAKMDDPNYWRTIRDKQTGKDVVLPDNVVSTIQNIRGGKYPSVGYNPYQPFLDLYSHEVMEHPINNEQDHKRSFLPSKLEAKKISKLVHAIKVGWIKPKQPKPDEDEAPKSYDLWAEEEEGLLSKSQLARRKMNIPAPKMKLPGHAESYNPPPEYLFTEDEKSKWEEQDEEDRKIDFPPQKFDCMRRIPQYSNFIKERFARCMDLYLAPRKRKMRLNVEAEDLLPKLPEPKDLRPFPTTLSLVYHGHKSAVRSISIEPKGQYFASVSDDPEVRIWEVSTGRCVRVIALPKVEMAEKPDQDGHTFKAHSIAWCPYLKTTLLAVAANRTLYLLNANVGDRLTVAETDNVIRSAISSNEASSEEKPDAVKWEILNDEFVKRSGVIIRLQHSKEIRQVSWHSNGDYFSTVCPEAGQKSVAVHQLSKAKSQVMFSKQKGIAQCALFHPTRAYFLIANQRNVRIYNLTTQQLVKKITTNCKSISSLAVHPQGDNIIVGSNDCRLDWVDLDLSTKPYKSFSKHHKAAVRSVCFHKHYPMFASSSSDGTVVVSHGMVYSDWTQNPLIVPLKILRPGKRVDLLACSFHPIQPWLFASGSDGQIRLFT